MRYGLIIPSGDPLFCAEIARVVERAGWDGVFIPDSLAIDTPDVPPAPMYDPWVTLAVMATATHQVRLGTMLTAIPRRRPWKLARELVTLDHLSGGRMILGAGMGAAHDDAGFYRVGEPLDRHTRAQRLDEGLFILAALMTGQPVTFQGQHFQVDGLQLLPSSVQPPRVPIWVVGAWPGEASLARAARYDGLIPAVAGANRPPTPDEITTLRTAVMKHRDPAVPYDIVQEGRTPGADRAAGAAQIAPYIQAGITWWLETLWEPPNGPDDIRSRARQGPPHPAR